jgi:hypothetical protein
MADFKVSSGAKNVPPGWQLGTVAGKRAARNPAGEVVAYNQYLKAQANVSGFSSYDAFQKYSHSNRFRSLRQTAEGKRRLALGSPDLRLLVQKGGTETREEIRRRPHGELAKLLEDIGRRPKGAEYPVGDTPGE